MIQRTSPSNKRPKISATRDFPHGCATNHRSVSVLHKENESVDLLMKKGDFNNVVANGNFGNARLVSDKTVFLPSRGSKVKPLTSEEAIELIASQSRRRHHSYSSGIIQRKPLSQQKHAISPEKKKWRNANALRTHQPTQHKIDHLSLREKVLKILRLFRILFKEFDEEKIAQCGKSEIAKSSIHYETRKILLKEGMQVNASKMIGPVPGIEVGDEFQFKSELNLIGLHFYITGGIDYMDRRDLKLATSIVASVGNGYIDKFERDVVIYCGQGGNLTSNNKKLIEDQKLVTGNLALVNSMKKKTPVRMIRGIRRLDKRGKCYVYDGLYLVHDYWREKGPRGNILFKFKLRRIPGQPFVDLKSKKVH